MKRILTIVLMNSVIGWTTSFRISSSSTTRRTRCKFSSTNYLPLTIENANLVLDDVRENFRNNVFYQSEELQMSGDVEVVDIDGMSLILRLSGKFWHERRVVFALVSAYLRARIPEISDILPVSDINLEDERKQAPDFNGDRFELKRLGYEPDDTVVINHRPGLTFTGYNI